MIEVNNVNVFNFDGAFHGLRNPMNSWDKNDTRTIIGYLDENPMFDPNCGEPIVGPNDMKLAQRMIGGGPEEAKFLRQIFVTMDIDAPFFWWKEMDTYKVGTVANSCSTMHKITSAPITMDNFSFGPYIEFYPMYEKIIEYCEDLRQKYLETKDKRYWRALIEILPEAWNQKRTWTANYQVLRNIYFQRRYHKLEEWHQFCDVIEKLPYGKELICYEKKEKNNEL
jgi:hypothetical protein